MRFISAVVAMAGVLPSWGGMRVQRTPLLGLFCLAFAGCEETNAQRENRMAYCPPEILASRYVGHMSKADVALVRQKLSQTKFPAPQFTVARMLPANLEPYGRVFVDGGRPDSEGRIGGNVMDYWLNPGTVLRIGTVYYPGEYHPSREEWFKWLTPKQAFAEEALRWPVAEWTPLIAKSAAK